MSRPSAQLGEIRSGLAPVPWTWLDQVHGGRVVAVDAPGARSGEAADAAVTVTSGCTLAIHTADCVPIVVAGGGGVAVAHAGWRGIVGGVIPGAIDALRELGAVGDLGAFIGPCIAADQYEFGSDDLDHVASVAGDAARGRTSDGEPALDLVAAVSEILRGEGILDVTACGLDTSSIDFFSHRTRADTGRQVTIAWLEDEK